MGGTAVAAGAEHEARVQGASAPRGGRVCSQALADRDIPLYEERQKFWAVDKDGRPIAYWLAMYEANTKVSGQISHAFNTYLLMAGNARCTAVTE